MRKNDERSKYGVQAMDAEQGAIKEGRGRGKRQKTKQQQGRRLGKGVRTRNVARTDIARRNDNDGFSEDLLGVLAVFGRVAVGLAILAPGAPVATR